MDALENYASLLMVKLCLLCLPHIPLAVYTHTHTLTSQIIEFVSCHKQYILIYSIHYHLNWKCLPYTHTPYLLLSFLAHSVWIPMAAWWREAAKDTRRDRERVRESRWWEWKRIDFHRPKFLSQLFRLKCHISCNMSHTIIICMYIRKTMCSIYSGYKRQKRGTFRFGKCVCRSTRIRRQIVYTCIRFVWVLCSKRFFFALSVKILFVLFVWCPHRCWRRLRMNDRMKRRYRRKNHRAHGVTWVYY